MKAIIYYLILIVLVIYFGSFYKKLMDQKTFIETFAFDVKDKQKYEMNTIGNNSVLHSYDKYNDSYSNLVEQNDNLDSNYNNNKYISFYDTIFNNFYRLKSDTDRIAPEIQRRNDQLTRDTNQFKQELSNDSNFLETNKSQIINKYKGQIDSNFKALDNSQSGNNNRSELNLPSSVQNMVGYRGNYQYMFAIQITGTTEGGAVWGTDIYTDDSFIAKAAVNAGVVKNGQIKTVYIEMMAGQNSYVGSNQNGASTFNYGWWGGSYRFVKPKLSPVENMKRSLNNLIKQNVNPTVVDKFVKNIPSNQAVISKINKLYKEGLDSAANQINAQELSFVQQMNDEVSVALAEKKKNLPNFNIGNNPGILVKIYSSPSPLNGLQLNGTLVNEYVVPAINYFSTSGIDSFFSGKKIAGVYRYLEFFGNLVVPRDTISIEFKLESAVGSRFYFAGAMVINDFNPNKSVDANSGLNYVVAGQKVPFKLQVMEGLDNTNNYVMLKWRLNQKGIFVAIPMEYYFLPDMNIN